jgi:hypothetical protein
VSAFLGWNFKFVLIEPGAEKNHMLLKTHSSICRKIHAQ